MRVDRQSRGEDGKAKTCLIPSENLERLPKRVKLERNWPLLHPTPKPPALPLKTPVPASQ